MTDQPDKLAPFRGALKVIAEYEKGQNRSDRHKREKLKGYLSHLQAWNRDVVAAGAQEKCPLLPLIREWADELGVAVPEPPASPAPEKRGGRQKAPPKAKAEKGVPKKTAEKGAGRKGEPPADPPAEAPAPDSPEQVGHGADPQEPEAGTGTQEPGNSNQEPDHTPLLPNGHWLKSHAAVVEKEVPAVKSRAADPDDYLAAKREFLARNLPLLEDYIAKPAKAPSPLFAYCALFLFDTGDLAGALRLSEEAIRLRQPSPIKRDFHQIQFDLQMEHLEREAEALAATGKRDKKYEELRALRDKLMASPFRYNHAKAKVCRTFASLAHALGDHEAARQNLQQVRFLDPNMGVETLLGKVEAALAAGKAPE